MMRDRVPVVRAAIVDSAIAERQDLTFDEIQANVSGNEVIDALSREQPEVIRFLEFQSVNIAKMMQNSAEMKQETVELVRTVFGIQLDAVAHFQRFLSLEMSSGD